MHEEVLGFASYLRALDCDLISKGVYLHEIVPAFTKALLTRKDAHILG
jgi:hypothetical protein